MRLIRRLDITWTEHQVVIYEKIREFAEQSKEPLPDFVKKIIDEHVTTIEKTDTSGK
jgi:hypothetical protein